MSRNNHGMAYHRRRRATVWAGLMSCLIWITLLQEGITADEKEWPFYMPADVAPPQSKTIPQEGNEIDTFLLQRLGEKGLKYTEKASKLTLMRRVYFDLIGLPPTPERIDTFFKVREEVKPDIVVRIRGVSFYNVKESEGRKLLNEWEDF